MKGPSHLRCGASQLAWAGIALFNCDNDAWSRLPRTVLAKNALKMIMKTITNSIVSLIRNRRLGGALAIIGAAVLLVSAVSCKKQSEARQEVKDVTICQWGQALIYLPLYMADQLGYFQDEGLKVKISNGGGDDLTWAAVTSGNAQFGIADPTMVAIQAEQGGVPGRVVGDIVGKVAFWAVTLNTNKAQISKTEDFKGETVACFKFPNTAHALALRTFQKGNLEVGKDVKMVEVNYSAVLAQLQSGGATIAMVLEPAASLAEAQGGKVVYSYPQAWGDFAFTGLTTTQKFIQENPDVVQKVVNALERAMRLAHTDPNRAVDCGVKAFPDLPKPVIERAVKRMLDEGTIPEHITPNAEGWDKAIDVCVQVGKLKNPAPSKAMLDPSFAKKAAGGMKP